MSRKAIYGFGLNTIEALKLNSIGAMNKVELCKLIKPNMITLKLEEIIEGKEADIEIEEDIEIPNEKVILFNGFSNNELNKVITDIRKVPELRGAIMAVVTETSKTWELKYLIGHLAEERERFRQAEKK